MTEYIFNILMQESYEKSLFCHLKKVLLYIDYLPLHIYIYIYIYITKNYIIYIYLKKSLYIYIYVTLDHKTSLKCQFLDIEMYTSHES